MIRAGRYDDIEACVDMAREFWAHTMYTDEFDPEHVHMMFQACLEQELFLVMIEEGVPIGFVVGLGAPLLANAGVKHVIELAFWITPGHRGAGRLLLKEFERVVAASGAKYLNMVALQSSMPGQVRRLYEQLGYEHSETVFTKQLGD